jgi:putative transcriptional regulator
MTSEIADSIRRGLEEAPAYAEGTADPSLYGVHISEDIDVKARLSAPPSLPASAPRRR